MYHAGLHVHQTAHEGEYVKTHLGITLAFDIWQNIELRLYAGTNYSIVRFTQWLTFTTVTATAAAAAANASLMVVIVDATPVFWHLYGTFETSRQSPSWQVEVM